MKRVLVWGLSNNRAGTEAVIEAYVRAADPQKYSFDFLCYDDPVNYGCLFSESSCNRVFKLPIKIAHPFRHRKALASFMDEHANEYEAVWFNANDISNIDILLAAEKKGIKHRILHSHNGNIPKRFITRLFSKINSKKAKRVVTERWACSQAAGAFMFEGESFKIIPNMVDARKFAFDPSARDAIRSQYGWSDDCIVGTVGRLSEQKDQSFLIELLPRLVQRIPNIKLVIIGEGPLRDSLKALAQDLGVEERVVLLPAQCNISEFLSAFDCYVFPSLYEGLSLAALEAQFNGLPCVMSDGVSTETKIATTTQFINLMDVDEWVDAICRAQRTENSLILEKAQAFDAANIREVAERMFEFD